MTDDETPNIAVRENAFIRAANVPSLKLADETEYEVRPVMALCRCGQSANKPFCDGSHKRTDFDGSGQDNAARDKVRSYEGTEITVHYTRLLCSHAAECGKRLEAVFDPDQRPWIQPDKGTPEAIMDVVRACPSGALRYSLKASDPQHLTSGETGISIEKDGPYKVTGIPLDGHHSSDFASSEKYVLCRCGLSKNKPFCDGTHRDEGWSDDA